MTSTVDSIPVPDQAAGRTTPVVELANVGKRYGNILAVSGINLTVRQGEVTCILGDNGAGKSTLIKIVAGLHPHDEGMYKVDGDEVRFGSPREALDVGISTVYQDLALVPLMPVWRNFFLGSELTGGVWPFRKLDVARMRRVADEELKKMGIDLPDIDAPVGNLSGGQMQVVAIARAIHFGARVLILDEPTAALGVKQSGVVLKYIAAARDGRPRGHLHHPQPAPRLPGGQPLRGAEPGSDGAGRQAGRAEPGRPHPAHGRRCGTRGAQTRDARGARRRTSVWCTT